LDSRDRKEGDSEVYGTTEAKEEKRKEEKGRDKGEIKQRGKLVG